MYPLRKRCIGFLCTFAVALPTEGVDRNAVPPEATADKSGSPSPRRAWIEICTLPLLGLKHKSPSPRRAWIEIPMECTYLPTGQSPSPRRAWIEIFRGKYDKQRLPVALPTEGVDRNDQGGKLCHNGRKSPSPRRAWIEILSSYLFTSRFGGRPPHGGRG